VTANRLAAGAAVPASQLSGRAGDVLADCDPGDRGEELLECLEFVASALGVDRERTDDAVRAAFSARRLTASEKA
jgi:hypothetical protein